MMLMFKSAQENCFKKYFVLIHAHLLVVMFPKVSVSALTGHVKDCEGKTYTYKKKKKDESCTISITMKIWNVLNMPHIT